MRIVVIVVLLTFLLMLSGCGIFNKPSWDMTRYQPTNVDPTLGFYQSIPQDPIPVNFTVVEKNSKKYLHYSRDGYR